MTQAVVTYVTKSNNAFLDFKVAAADESFVSLNNRVTLTPTSTPEGVDFSGCVVMVQNTNYETTTVPTCQWDKTASTLVVSGVRSATGAFDFGVVILTPPGYCTALPGGALGLPTPTQPALSDEEASMLPVYRCTINPNGGDGDKTYLTNVKARGGMAFSMESHYPSGEGVTWLMTPTNNPLLLTFSSCMPQLSGSSTANCPMAWDAGFKAYVFAPNTEVTQTFAKSNKDISSAQDDGPCFQFILWP